MQVNRQVVALPYMKNELHVYQSGINYVVEISKLGALITYNGLSFSITLPHRLFGNNTKGQCGEPLGPCGLLPPEEGSSEVGGWARAPASPAVVLPLPAPGPDGSLVPSVPLAPA